MSAGFELRRQFHDEMAELRSIVDAMTARLLAALPEVTAALVKGAGEPVEACRPLPELHGHFSRVEAAVFQLVARQAPVAGDLRFLIAILRVAQELERCADLVCSIGRRVPVSPEVLTPARAQILARTGQATADLLGRAMVAFLARDPQLALQVVADDDEVDDLHRALLASLFDARVGPVEAAVDLGLIARFYERIADHAVVIAQRARFLGTGELDATDTDEQPNRG